MNVVFVHIPKAAGKSITRAMGLKRFVGKRGTKAFNGEDKVTFLHQLYPELLKNGIISEEYDRDSFKFCFSRNPYDRAVSHWQYTMRRHPDRLMRGTSFVDFTRALGSRRDWIPQSTWLEGVDYSFIGRFENLHEDVHKVGEMTGITIERIPKINTTRHNHYSNYYSAEARWRVEEYYKDDFKNFDYEMEI